MPNTKDCNLSKMQLAHDYFMKNGNHSFIEADVEQAWLYADLMFEQLEKRNLKDLDYQDVEDIVQGATVVEGFTVSWDKLPEWAEWFAIDRDGCCYIYSYKPQTIDGYDYWADFKDESGFTQAKCIGSVDYVKDWKKTLIKRPSL